MRFLQMATARQLVDGDNKLGGTVVGSCNTGVLGL